MEKNKYNAYFKDMVLMGLSLGLSRPHEWICNYDRFDSLYSLEQNKERDEFLNLVIVDIYSALTCDNLSFKEANDLYNKDLNKNNE
jgi:hypothetical protein